LEIRKEARELTPPHAVRHYTVKKIAKIWNLSADTIVRIFENEPGVIVISERRKHSIIHDADLYRGSITKSPRKLTALVARFAVSSSTTNSSGNSTRNYLASLPTGT
jgi:hypothetical protein